jgi:subtilase family serine protease
VLRKSKSRLIWSGVLAAAIAGTGTAIAAGTTTVSGNVAGWVKNATLKSSASATTSVTVSVNMALKNVAGLKSFVAEVSNPNGREYGQYLSTEQFAARYAPAAADVAAVEKLLEQAGMKDVTVGPHGAYVSATATVAELRTAFKVSQNLYTYQGFTLRANKEAPTIPASLAGKIIYIGGLDDTGMMRKPFHRSITQGELVAPKSEAAASPSATAVTPPPVAASNGSPYCNHTFGSGALVAKLSTPADVYGASLPWLGCGYTPAQVRSAYGFDQVSYNGKGVTVAIVDAYASPTILNDINDYSVNNVLPKLTNGVTFTQIVPAGIYSVSPTETCGPYGWWEEESLDVSAVHSGAPGAKIVYVGSRDCMTSLDVAFMNAVYNHVADVVTDSWGDNGEAIAPGDQQSYDQALMAGAAQGITVLFSSGDNGDLSAPNGVASGSWPATSAYVTGVGGTSLLITNTTGGKSEYGWGNYRAFLDDVTINSSKSVTTSGVATITAFGYTFDDYEYYAGSGGGISLLEAQPSYQAKAVPADLANSLNLASGYVETLPNQQRVSPDVAMLGDPYTGFIFGETFTIAGNAIADKGCAPSTKTTEYCQTSIGGTSVASPWMAGVMAVLNSKRIATGEPLVGFANPLLYGIGSHNTGTSFKDAINQIIAPTEPVALLRGYTADATELRVVTVNSVPFVIISAPYALEVCGLPICLGVNDVFNYTSLSPAAVPPTPAGYNDVTGLGVPWVPKLINEE